MDRKKNHDLYKLKLAKDVKEEVISWIKKPAIITSVLERTFFSLHPDQWVKYVHTFNIPFSTCQNISKTRQFRVYNRLSQKLCLATKNRK